MRLLSLVIAVVLFTGLANAALPKSEANVPQQASKELYQCFYDTPITIEDMYSVLAERGGRLYVMVYLFTAETVAKYPDSPRNPDLILAYPYKGYGQLSPIPTVYLINRDGDQEIDEEWNDMDGSGRCQAMRQFPVMKHTDKEM